MKRIFSILFALALVLGFSLVMAVPALAVGPVHNVTKNTYYGTIQAAIDDANPGDIIMAAAATYHETVTLKSTTASGISIIGEDKDTTFITGGVCFAADYSGLKVQNFTITGNGYLGTETYEATVSCKWPTYYAVTNLEFSNCIFDGEGYNDGKHGRCGVLIKRLGGVVKFENNEFKNYRGWATLDVNDGSGAGFLTVTSYTFNNNNVHDNWGSCGLRGNPADRTNTVTVTGNTLGNNGNSAQYAWAALEINEADDVTVSNNTITNTHPGSWGEGEALQFWHITPTCLTVTCNNIVDNYAGIYFPGDSYGSDLSGVHINHNNIYGNTQFGVWADPGNTGTADAENNWWGDDSGPYNSSSNPTGTGNPVSNNVDFDPWNRHAVDTKTGLGPASFSSSKGNVVSLTAVTPPATSPVTLPYGMFSFQVCCINPGDTVTVTVTLPGPVPVGTRWWKYQGGSWYSLPIGGDGTSVITVTLKDETPTEPGLGDEDSTEGLILDPGGPGPGPVGWETYPISKVRVLLPWIALLAAMMVGVSVLVLRRRRAQS
jgi:hypothetical protein